MNKALVAIIIVLIVGVGTFYYFRQSAEAPTNGAAKTANSTPTPTASTELSAEKIVVGISESGFSPATINIKMGTTVTFKNVGTEESWPASAKHPDHKQYPDQDSCFAGKFDESCGIPGGGNWSYKFNRAGPWNYHDHLHPTLFGKIVVE